MRIATFSVALFAALYLLALFLLMGLNRPWWHRTWVRRLALVIPLAALVLAGLIALGRRLEQESLVQSSATLLSALYMYLIGTLIALLIAGLFHSGERVYDLLRFRCRKKEPPLAGRRLFLRRALVGVPLLTTGMVTDGLIRATAPARLPRISLRYPDLPAPLAGLRILHLSDIHLGPYVQLEDLEALLGRAAELDPDLVLITGDLCDHLPSYPDALRLIEGLQPPLGIFASLGNHEYFRGLSRVRKYFAQSSIPLLIDQGMVLQVGNRQLHLSGADDPRFMHSPESYMRLRRSVEKAQESAPSQAFRILLSHRSQAFDYSAPLGVDLTLAGHTHGFQLGFGGRSLFELLLPERYPWGLYRKGNQQLYTTAGVGHWFPFRLGCPPEAPLYILST